MPNNTDPSRADRTVEKRSAVLVALLSGLFSALIVGTIALLTTNSEIDSAEQRLLVEIEAQEDRLREEIAAANDAATRRERLEAYGPFLSSASAYVESLLSTHTFFEVADGRRFTGSQASKERLEEKEALQTAASNSYASASAAAILVASPEIADCIADLDHIRFLWASALISESANFTLFPSSSEAVAGGEFTMELESTEDWSRPAGEIVTRLEELARADLDSELKSNDCPSGDAP